MLEEKESVVNADTIQRPLNSLSPSQNVEALSAVPSQLVNFSTLDIIEASFICEVYV